MKIYRRKLYMERTERTRCVSIHAQPPTRSRHLCFFGDNNIEKTNKPSTEALNYRVFMCDQKHTSAMKMSCSAAFNRTFNILHCRSFILINTLGFETHPDANMHQEPWKSWESLNRGISYGWDSVGHHCVVLIRDTAASVSKGTGWGWHFSHQVSYRAQI